LKKSEQIRAQEAFSYLDLNEDVGEGVGEGDVTEGLQAVPDLLRRGDAGADANSGEASLEPTVSCNSSNQAYVSNLASTNHVKISCLDQTIKNLQMVCAIPRESPIEE
jgi:hypothetical protein